MRKGTLIITIVCLFLSPWHIAQKPTENSINEIDKYITDSLELNEKF